MQHHPPNLIICLRVQLLEILSVYQLNPLLKKMGLQLEANSVDYLKMSQITSGQNNALDGHYWLYLEIKPMRIDYQRLFCKKCFKSKVWIHCSWRFAKLKPIKLRLVKQAWSKKRSGISDRLFKMLTQKRESMWWKAQWKHSRTTVTIVMISALQ